VVDGLSRGDEVVVPEGGLVDGAANRSGEAGSLEVGEGREVDWPPVIGSACERGQPRTTSSSDWRQARPSFANGGQRWAGRSLLRGADPPFVDDAIVGVEVVRDAVDDGETPAGIELAGVVVTCACRQADPLDAGVVEGRQEVAKQERTVALAVLGGSDGELGDVGEGVLGHEGDGVADGSVGLDDGE
jgi:hypothetical protein